MTYNLGTLLETHAAYRPNHNALVFGSERITFKELNKRVNQLTSAMERIGIAKGDKVATILPNCIEQLELYWASAKIGAVVVPLSPLLTVSGLKALINDSHSLMIVTNKDKARLIGELLDEIPRVRNEWIYLIDDNFNESTDFIYGNLFQSFKTLRAKGSDEYKISSLINGNTPFNIIYSSGTTGLPKGIVHTHQIRANYATSFASAFRMTPESVVLQAGAVIFNGAFLTLMPSLFLGCSYILSNKNTPEELVEIISKEKVTHMMMVPSQIISLMEAENFSLERVNSLEMILSLGAPLHVEYKERINQLLPDRFYELYGLTEGFVTILDKTVSKEKSGSVGTPPPFYEIKVVDDDGNPKPIGEIGEIIGKGTILMQEYYNRPKQTGEAIRGGYLYSGDLGYLDEDGYLYLVDRKKDMIISGGVNVYPKDIEEVIVCHPKVKEVAVFGVSDKKWGEIPIAAVTIKGENSNLADLNGQIIRWANERVGARYQKISDVVVMDDLPRNIAGKILKRDLKQLYQT